MKSLTPPSASVVASIPVPPAKWSSGIGVTAFKREFGDWALTNQEGRCAYCCLPVGTDDERRPWSLDHIAPQGSTLYPQFAFEILNIVLACSACNERLKLATDTVAKVAAAYKACSFTIVHPYLHPVHAHLVGTYQGDDVEIVAPRWLSVEGKATIAMFKLDNPGYIRVANKEARAIRMEAAQGSLPMSLLYRFKAALRELRGH